MFVTNEVQRSIRGVLERLIEAGGEPFLRVACCLWKQACIEVETVFPRREDGASDSEDEATEHPLTAEGAWDLFLELGAGRRSVGLFAAGSGGVITWPVAPGIILVAELKTRSMMGVGRVRLRRAAEEIVALVG